MTKELAVQPIAMADLQTMAKSIAASAMFGVKTEDQAMALMLLCQAEGIHPIMALRRYHIIEGRPAYRADALQGEFEREGAILWHERDEKICAATFWRDKHKMNDAAIKRAKERYDVMINGGSEARFATPGEITVIRTMVDAVEKKVAMSWNAEKGEYKMKKNWKQSPRQMLHARCLTEGVRAVNPGLVAGIYTEDEVRDSVEAEVVNDGATDQAVTSTLSEIAERRVRQATANATETAPIVADSNGANDYGPLNITKDNYGELASHIGQAKGNLLGVKVKDLNGNIITWLFTKWRNGLTPSATDQDMRLKAAVEFAHEAQQEKDSRAGDAADVVTDAPAVSNPTDAAKAAATDLRQRISDLILTEDQAIKYLRGQGMFAGGWTKLEHATESILLYLCTPTGWNTFKKVVEDDVKPKQAAATKPARKRAK